VRSAQHSTPEPVHSKRCKDPMAKRPRGVSTQSVAALQEPLWPWRETWVHTTSKLPSAKKGEQTMPKEPAAETPHLCWNHWGRGRRPKRVPSQTLLPPAARCAPADEEAHNSTSHTNQRMAPARAEDVQVSPRCSGCLHLSPQLTHSFSSKSGST
jgi:hypothetical protein